MEKNRFLIASVLCYCFSLILPSFVNDDEVGFYFLVYGWMSFFNPIGFIYVFGLPWLANFTFLINLFLSRFLSIRFQILISIITIFLSAPVIVIGDGNESFMMKMNLGSWFWLLSFIVLLIGQIQNLFLRKSQ